MKGIPVYLLVFLLFNSIYFMPIYGFDLLSLIGIGKQRKKEREDKTEPVSEDKAKQYLQNFGYIGPSAIIGNRHDLSADLSDIKDAFSAAVKKFQEFAGLKPTGSLDIKTKKKMAEPRCGVFDVRAITTGREATYSWKKNQITYSILSFSPDLPERDIKKAINAAFSLWSEVTPLEFTEVSSSDSSADIKVKFAANDHGDPWPFDGRGGVLAHATMPTSGMLHFDEDENWVYMDAKKIASYRYTDIYPVAIHEIGHALGLDHSRTEDSIMAPFYQETVDDNGNYVMPTLRPIDIQAIQAIYVLGPGKNESRTGGGTSRSSWSSWSDSEGTHRQGGRSKWSDEDDNSFTTTHRPTTKSFFGTLWSKWLGDGSSSRSRSRTEDNNRDDSSSAGGRRGSSSSRGSSDSDNNNESGGQSFDGDCPRTIDAITPGLDGIIYIFQGSKVYEARGNSIIRTHSLRILFPKGPLYVEAAYINDRSQIIVLFQSYQTYVFEYSSSQRKFMLSQGYPKRLAKFNPIGAMQWIDGHQFLFLKNNEFAVYDEYWNEITAVNSLSDYLPGFPSGVKGGISNGSGTVLLFTTSRVYRYNAARKVATGDSETIAKYFGC